MTKVLFIISGSETAFWLSEVTHPYWHLIERGVEIDFASPEGGKVVYDAYSDPYFENSLEAEDIVSKGFLSDKDLVAKFDTTLKLSDLNLDDYDAVHVAGGRGATFDLFPNAEVGKVLKDFWTKNKVVGTICHGSIALGNIPEQVAGRRTTGYTLEADKYLQGLFGPTFEIPNYPQTVLESVSTYSRAADSNDPYVIRDGQLVTGQNQQSASEYSIVLLAAIKGESPVVVA